MTCKKDFLRNLCQKSKAEPGKSRAEVSHDLTQLALYLDIHHPLLFLRRAEDGWMQFWGEASPAETSGRKKLAWSHGFRLAVGRVSGS